MLNFYTLFGGPHDGEIKTTEDRLISFCSNRYKGIYYCFDDFAIYVEE